MDGEKKKERKIIKQTILILLVAALAALSLIFFSSYYASASTVIFLDDFTDNLNWTKAREDLNDGSRKTSDGGFTVGTSGDGYLLKGATGSNPDQGVQRAISTHGFSTITIQYSRAFSSFESDDDLRVEYQLDGEASVSLEIIHGSGTVAHSLSPIFTISNPDRHTKLTLKFLVDANNSDDKVGIDDVSVTGDNSPLFYDGFESNNFTIGGWAQEEAPTITHSASDIWTDNNSSSDGHAANVDGSNNSDPDDAIIKPFNSSGLRNIKVRYARKTSGMESDDQFRALYSINGGVNWVELESFTGNKSYESKLFTLPSSANNNSNLQIRFEVSAGGSGDNSFIDDVVIWGEPLPTGAISGSKFNDLNGNHVKDGSEPGLSNWTINLTGASSATIVTTATGGYEFSALDDGVYYVCETLKSSWTQTFPTSGYNCDDSTGYTVTISGGSQITSQNFGNIKYGSITAVKSTNPGDSDQEFTFNLNSANPQVLTNSQSYAYQNLVPGTYDLSEVMPDGWFSQSISCIDQDQNTIADPTNIALTAGENAICTFSNTQYGSITITKIFSPTDGSFAFNLSGDATDTWTATTSGQSHTFSNLQPGSYSIEEVVPEGWIGDQQNNCTDDIDSSDFELSAGQNISCTFNNTEFATISGVKFEDLNGNGVKNDGESGVSDWKISLIQLSGSDELASVSATTSESGNYIFQSLLPSEYQLCEYMQNNWHQSSPISGQGECQNGTNGYSIELSAGQNVIGKDFGNYQKGSISGRKFEDVNGDGEFNGSDHVLSGWPIKLYDNEESLLDTQTTDEETGSYTFSNLNPGDYVVRETAQDNWTQKAPANASYSISLSSDDEVGNKDFGNFHNAAIVGHKYNDLDGDGALNEGESGLNDWVINLSKAVTSVASGSEDLITTYQLVSTATTSEGGLFSFNINSVGAYRLTENNKSGWTRTSPASNSYIQISISQSGQTITTYGDEQTIRFLNHQLVIISGESSNDAGQTSTTITWQTDLPATSRVVYDTISHSVLGDGACSSPHQDLNCYGYANTTGEQDNNSKVTNHSVSISGLTAGTIYYYRAISKASPESVGNESSFSTGSASSLPSNGGGGGGSGGPVGLPLTPTPSPSSSLSPSLTPLVLSSPLSNPSNAENQGGNLSDQIASAFNSRKATPSTTSTSSFEFSPSLTPSSVETFSLLANIAGLFGIKWIWWIALIVIVLAGIIWAVVKSGKSKD